MSVIASVEDDLRAVLATWRESVANGRPAGPDDAIDAVAKDCAARAAELIHTDSSSVESTTARVCLVAKQPHLRSDTAIIALIGRLLAAGVIIHKVRRLEHMKAGADVARQLYPLAYTGYAERPASRTVWDALASRFDNDRFSAVFGQPYSPKFVLCATEAMAQFGLTDAGMTEIWEEGRRPVTRDVFAARYGRQAADAVLGDESHYSWFRGPWPVGIQRMTPGLVAFAMRHERLAGGAPVVVLNGHFPGLVELFGPETTAIEAGLPSASLSIDGLRRWVIGHDNRPADCETGTIRRDATVGRFPVDSDDTVDSRRNLVHCSDGLLAGAIECCALLDNDPGSGALPGQLALGGLTKAEIETIVLADPLIRTPDGEQRLTYITRGHDIEKCADTILRLVPPIFGAANGFGSGLSLHAFGRELTKLAHHDWNPESYSHLDLGAQPMPRPAVRPADIPHAVRTSGLAAIGAGKVAFVVPAGGTGGRFGSYAIPESDPRRQKALAPVFQMAGNSRSGLDVRLANARYWRERTKGRLPVAVLSSPTNSEQVSGWCAAKRADGFDDLVSYQQYGVYRVHAAPNRIRAERWMDDIVRIADGTPSLKPPGNLGILTCLALCGVLGAWEREGIEFLAIANGDDVGFRLDPAILGLLAQDDTADAVVSGVPWGFTGFAEHAGDRVNVRADVGGFCADELGRIGTVHESDGAWEVDFNGVRRPLAEPVIDSGGLICALESPGGWRTAIAERVANSSLVGKSLYNTNQIYIRISKLTSVLGLAGSGELAPAIRDFVSRQPFYAECKEVLVDDERMGALQIVQGANDVLRHMRLTATEISRHGTDGGRSGYAALKRAEDIPFAQLVLDHMSKRGDDLNFD